MIITIIKHSSAGKGFTSPLLPGHRPSLRKIGGGGLKQEQRQDPQRKAAYWPALVLKGSSSTSFYFLIQPRPTPIGIAPPTGILSESLALSSSTNITDNAHRHTHWPV